MADAGVEGVLRPGASKILGNEVDVIVGFEEIGGIPNLSGDFQVGYFRAGKAFAEETDDDAFLVGFGLEVTF